MKQRYYFAKLACESSATTSTELCRFFRQADLLRVQAFLTNLQQVSTPPVLYFGAYLDYWSSGLRFSELGKLADSYSWEGLPSLQVAVFQDTAYLKLDSLTEEWKRQFQEDSWFLEAVKRVRGSWEDMGLESVMLVFRLGLGSLVTDEEVRESVSCPLLRDLIASAEKTTSQGEESREKGAS